jgi:nitroreductase
MKYILTIMADNNHCKSPKLIPPCPSLTSKGGSKRLILSQIWSNPPFSQGVHRGIFFAVFLTIIILSIQSCNSDIEAKNETTEKQEMNEEKYENETLKTIFSRKSVRHYINKDVSKEQLELIVKAGMAAPTAVNMQPWSFVIVKERETLDKLADALPYCKMLFEAPAAIVVCAVPEWSIAEHPEKYSIIDCSAATQNILLAVESMGLGAVWTAAYPRPERMESVRKILDIPEKIIPLNVIPIGYPTGEDKPKDKWKPDRLHWEKW